jgi:hypothetical protein
MGRPGAVPNLARRSDVMNLPAPSGIPVTKPGPCESEAIRRGEADRWRLLARDVDAIAARRVELYVEFQRELDVLEGRLVAAAASAS